MTKSTHLSGFDSIKIEGGILSADVLHNVRSYNMPRQTTDDYGLAKGLKMSEELGRYWRIAKTYWTLYREQCLRDDIDLAHLTVQEWLLPLLDKVLGFRDVQATVPLKIGERHFPISHGALNSTVPLLLTGQNFELDKGDIAFGEQDQKRSPAGLVQEYLNADNQVLWAIVSNGLQLRILRDNPAMTRPAYIEIDLERLFDEELYVDFTVFWLLTHASRFALQNEQINTCLLEDWRKHAVVTGERVLDKLRAGVTEALRQLGTGFISHPNNQNLREQLQNGNLSKEVFFQQLLRLVYRFLFLFTAEDRQILLSPEAPDSAKQLYEQGYSLSILREKARKRRHYDDYADCWQQLLITFSGFAAGQKNLAQPALGGLFAADQCPDLENSDVSNKQLLSALFQLSFFTSEKILSRINYRDLDTEELGSVYESLLELIPDIKVNGHWSFQFLGDEDSDAVKGHARKLTGSYYTPDSLVQELIKSALEPVIKERLQQNPNRRTKAILDIKVCDPACGSGHFLLAAARRLAAELARLNARSDQPSEQHYRHALREVVCHCIYGVDLNPLAVELCKTALWLEALEPGKPLSFLDARIRHGNALVGVPFSDLMQNGIPDKAYMALISDDKKVCAALKKSNKAHQLVSTGDIFSDFSDENTLPEFIDLNQFPEDNLQQIQLKRERWQSYHNSDSYQQTRLQEDVFTAAFFAEKTSTTAMQVPTNEDLNRLRQQSQPRHGVLQWVTDLANQHQFFHWSIEFPEVFSETEHRHAGFDVMLGNPPWEVSQLSEEEFFASRSPEIAIKSGAKRKKAIEDLKEINPWLWNKFVQAKFSFECTNQFYRNSGRFGLTAIGKLNVYALFAENFLKLLNNRGRAGVIVPTGIATDDSTKAFFDHITSKQHLVSLYDFENKEAIFQGVHRSYKFCLLTLGHQIKQANFIFFTTQTTQLDDERRRFRLSAEDISLLNPNTRTCPVFRSQKDAELTKKIYRQAAVLINENTELGNPWRISFSQGLFNMTSASHLFKTYRDLNESEAFLQHNSWQMYGQTYDPLYEAKMVHQFDHRWATYAIEGETSRDASLSDKQRPDYCVRPRYWIAEWEVTKRITDLPKALFVTIELRAENETNALTELSEVLAQWLAGFLVEQQQQAELETLVKACRFPELAKALKQLDTMDWQKGLKLQLEFPLNDVEVDILLQAKDLWGLLDDWIQQKRRRWLLGFRDICRSTDERTVIASIVPSVGVGNNMPLIFSNSRLTARQSCLLFANLNTLVFDFSARHKVGGTHLNFFIIKQLPVLTLDQYTFTDLDYIVPRVLELTYTSHDLKAFAEDLGYHGKPFAFNLNRRPQLRCELDAYYARLYQLSRDELRYILDPADVMGQDYPSETFRVLKNKEMNEFGEYRTRRLVLEAYDHLAEEFDRCDPHYSGKITNL